MLLTDHQVAHCLTVGRATVWRYTRTDPTFPKPIKLSAGCARWRVDEVEQWLASRPRTDAA